MAKFVPMLHVLKQNSRPRLKIDLFSNELPRDFSGPAVIKPMLGSSVEDADRPMLLCSRYRANVIFTEPKEKPPKATM
ncbi:hypothetical protein ACFX11_012817 [Malus domestica]